MKKKPYETNVWKSKLLITVASHNPWDCACRVRITHTDCNEYFASIGNGEVVGGDKPVVDCARNQSHYQFYKLRYRWINAIILDGKVQHIVHILGQVQYHHTKCPLMRHLTHDRRINKLNALLLAFIFQATEIINKIMEMFVCAFFLFCWKERETRAIRLNEAGLNWANAFNWNGITAHNVLCRFMCRKLLLCLCCFEARHKCILLFFFVYLNESKSLWLLWAFFSHACVLVRAWKIHQTSLWCWSIQQLIGSMRLQTITTMYKQTDKKAGFPFAGEKQQRVKKERKKDRKN